MKNVAKTLIFVCMVAFLSTIAFPIAAQIQPIGAGTCTALGLRCGNTTTDLMNYIVQIVNVILGFVGVLAAIYLVISGIRYITAQGNDSTLKEAKNGIIYALIGLIVIGLSAAIVNFILLAFS